MLQELKISAKDISLIGVTTAPGLIGPLLTGLTFAKSLALLYELPLLGVNHLFAHLEAIHLSNDKVSYPYLGCLFSGGHSLFVIVQSSSEWEFIGSTIDDAAGESLDKAGKLLGIAYPCGKIIDEFAQWGDPHKYSFPRPMVSKEYGLKMSFSGLKNAFRLKIESEKILEKNLPLDWWKSPVKIPELQNIYDLLASYQYAVINSLFTKMQLAYKKISELDINYKNIPIVFGGGVACNSLLRNLVKNWSENNKISAFFVAPEYCTDNGAMIANFVYRNQNLCVPFPQCLNIDAKSSLLTTKKDQFS